MSTQRERVKALHEDLDVHFAETKACELYGFKRRYKAAEKVLENTDVFRHVCDELPAYVVVREACDAAARRFDAAVDSELESVGIRPRVCMQHESYPGEGFCRGMTLDGEQAYCENKVSLWLDRVAPDGFEPGPWR